jgi:hypothetical protein
MTAAAALPPHQHRWMSSLGGFSGMSGGGIDLDCPVNQVGAHVRVRRQVTCAGAAPPDRCEALHRSWWTCSGWATQRHRRTQGPRHWAHRRPATPHCRPRQCRTWMGAQHHPTKPFRARVSVSRDLESDESIRASPPHRPREDGLTRPAGTSRSNLAAALGLARWRLSKPRAMSNLRASVWGCSDGKACMVDVSDKVPTQVGVSPPCCLVVEPTCRQVSPLPFTRVCRGQPLRPLACCWARRRSRK